jgi:hypothetical protein
MSHIHRYRQPVFRNSNLEGFEGTRLLLSYDLRDGAYRGEEYYNEASDFQ